MNARPPQRLEKLAVLLLVAGFVLPLSLTRLISFSMGRGGWMETVGNAIYGAPRVLPPEVAPLCWANVVSSRYQGSLAKNFDEGFAGREWIIRGMQDIYLRLFHSTSAPIVIGRGGSMYYDEAPYAFVREYASQRIPPSQHKRTVESLRSWQESCRSRGVALAVVITPSKASILPEDLPAGWRKRYDPRPRAYEQFVQLLQQSKVPYIDGHVLTAAAKADAPTPVFPLGGTHWSEYASLISANAVLHEFQEQGQPVQPIEGAQTLVSNAPSREDRDMLDTINPLFRWRFPVAKMNYPPVPLPESRRPSLVVIGGSFLNSLAHHLYRSNQFSEIHWLRYYNVAKELPIAHGEWNVLAKPIVKMDVDREIFAARCLVIEINEQQLVDAPHLRFLFDETAGRLPAKGAPPALFTYETCLPCRWGEPLDFTRAETLARREAFEGFSGAQVGGTQSEGPESVLRLIVPSAEEGAVLTVEAGAIIVPEKLPVQKVSVFANDQPVAEWTYDSPGMYRRQVTLPRAVLGDGRLVLRFRFSQTISPAEVDPSSGDHRKLAVVIRELALQPTRRRVDGPVFAAGVLPPGMQNSSVYGAGFGEPEPTGRWTVGPRAALRLPVPPGEGDLVLSAEVRPVLDSERLRVGRAAIFVNGQPVGEWESIMNSVQRREVRIPRALLTAGTEMEVLFYFAKTLSPAEAGRGGDQRQLGFFFQSVQEHWFVPVDEPAVAALAPVSPERP